VRRTQRGNNNAYCQDNELNWFDWTLPGKNAALLRFWQRMIAFRRRHANVHRQRFFTGAVNERGLADITWHGCQLNAPGWNDSQARTLAFTLGGFAGAADVHVMFNMYWEPVEFELPTVADRAWHRAVDTSLSSPDDIADEGREVRITGDKYIANGRSVVVLISK
jgi:glycogen operon protein